MVIISCIIAANNKYYTSDYSTHTNTHTDTSGHCCHPRSQPRPAAQDTKIDEGEFASGFKLPPPYFKGGISVITQTYLDLVETKLVFERSMGVRIC